MRSTAAQGHLQHPTSHASFGAPRNFLAVSLHVHARERSPGEGTVYTPTLNSYKDVPGGSANVSIALAAVFSLSKQMSFLKCCRSKRGWQVASEMAELHPE